MTHKSGTLAAFLMFCWAAVQAVTANDSPSLLMLSTGQTPTMTEFPVPTVRAGLAGITRAADGSFWFTETSANKIGRMTSSGVFTEYAVPTLASAPEAITTSPDGYVWFTEHYGHKIGRIGQAGGAIAEFT